MVKNLKALTKERKPITIMKRKIILLSLIVAMIILIFFMTNSPFAPFYWQGFLVTMGILTALWVFTLYIKDSSIIDIYWGLGFVLLAWFYLWLMGEEYQTTRNLIFASMVSVWGLRLTGYLGWRNIGKGEDYRYVEMRAETGENWWWVSYLQVFLLQGVIMWIVASVFLPVFDTETGFSTLDYLGIALWFIGLTFEVVGDWQLAQFKKNPANKGKVLATGLWKYTRHPNYFGDALLWWGFFCFALAYSRGFFWLYSPLFMTFLLLKVSGVALLESTLKKTKPQYTDYIRRTSAFFPLPPKK